MSASIARISSRRPVAVAMLFATVILLGSISFRRLPIDLLPDVSYPQLVVLTSYPDVAPQEIERLITRRIEAEGAAVPGVERVMSMSREGVSLVTLRFRWGTDMDFAMLHLRESMDNLRHLLPETAARPRIQRLDPRSAPVLTLSVAGGGDLFQTKELAQTVFRRRLEQLDGVARAVVTGGLDREIQVEVAPELLDVYGLSLTDVSHALAAANVRGGSGTVVQGRYRYPLRTLGEITSVGEIGDVTVGRSSRGAALARSSQPGVGSRLIRLRDIAQIVDGFAERQSIVRYGGREAVGILVFKESGANTVAVAESVDGVVEQLSLEYPDITVHVAESEAPFVVESVSSVVQALVFGGLLAVLVLLLFLRDSRYPLVIASAIPISVVATFALMELAGVSLNVMSLGGLALGVGMLVDNSIVVLENIFRHHEGGLRWLEAAAKGAEEVQGAITASTLTTISVFGPIIYVEGLAGELFGDLSLAVAFSLLVSLVVALTLLPAAAGRFGAGGERTAGASPGRGLHHALGPLLRTFDRTFSVCAAHYHRALEWALDHRGGGGVLGAATGALAAALLVGLSLPRDLLPDVDQGTFEVRMTPPEGIGLEVTAQISSEIDTILLEGPGVAALFSQVGRQVHAYARAEGESGPTTAVFQVRVEDGHRTHDVVERLRPVTERFSLATMSFETGRSTALGSMLAGDEADVSVRIRGDDLDAMYGRAIDVRDRLIGLPELGNVRVGTRPGRPEIHVEVLPEVAARYDLEPRTIADAVDAATRGDLATGLVDFDRKIGVIVRYPRDLGRELRTLETLKVAGVPLREFVRVQRTSGPREVYREGQARVIPVYADVHDGGLDQAIERIRASIDDLRPVAGLRMDVAGEGDEMKRSFRGLSFAFALGLALVYMILAAQFESFVHPLTVLVPVPLALVGAVLALLFTGQGMNTMGLIGGVILVGIVVNDAIVKVDFINRARAAGQPVRDAILEAGRVRLRPILMTTVTTVLGLLPMAFGLGRGADLRAPLAITVIGGLIVSTVLTLIVVPVVYSFVEGARPASRGGESNEPAPLPSSLRRGAA